MRSELNCTISQPYRLKRQPTLDYLAYRVPELIPVLGSQPVGDVSHKPGGPVVTLATLKTSATNFAAW